MPLTSLRQTLFFSHILNLFTDCTETLEAKPFFITSIHQLMKDPNGQLETTLKHFCFVLLSTAGSDSVLRVQVRDVRTTSLLSAFRYDFSEQSQVSELGLGSTAL